MEFVKWLDPESIAADRARNRNLCNLCDLCSAYASHEAPEQSPPQRLELLACTMVSIISLKEEPRMICFALFSSWSLASQLRVAP
jgi:hypothetical protein